MALSPRQIAFLAGICLLRASACQCGACAVIWCMKFVFLVGVLCVGISHCFLESFHLFVFLVTV